jgi:hypothetical protein
MDTHTTTTTKSAESLRAEDLQRKLSKVTARFESAQGTGWVPGQSGTDSVDSASIADALETISKSGDNDTVAKKVERIQL